MWPNAVKGVFNGVLSENIVEWNEFEINGNRCHDATLFYMRAAAQLCYTKGGDARKVQRQRRYNNIIRT
jgi:hypothetical protein